MSSIFAHSSITRLLILGVVGVVLAGTLASCGKKPSDVEPPVGAAPSGYPGMYPDPATDPRP